MEEAKTGRRIKWRALMVGVAAAALAACATPYQQKGPTGGFADSKLGPGRYTVEFTGNGNTPADWVADMFLYRCAELTVNDGYDVFRSAEPGTPGAAEPMQPLGDNADDAQPALFASRVVPIYIPSVPRTVTIHRMVGVVRMDRYADVPSNLRAWDARAVMMQLEPLVRGSARTPVPIHQIAKLAMVNGQGHPVAAGSTTLDDLRRLLPRPQE